MTGTLKYGGASLCLSIFTNVCTVLHDLSVFSRETESLRLSHVNLQIFMVTIYSILNSDWLIYLHITVCKYRSGANNWCKYFIEHAHFENDSSA
jgi:hypothetical protein